MSGAYDEIIGLPHHVSSKRRQMSIENRAAQFAPFAALSGYGAAISETGRLTDKKLELDEYEKAVINERLNDLQARISSRPAARFTYFVPDARKAGGAYVEVTGAVKKIDDHAQAVVLMNGTRIPFDDIAAVSEEEIAD